MSQPKQLVEHFFRHESANLIAVLTRAFGVRRLELVEDMVQSAMVEAMHAWRHRGPPDNPAAWIHRVAKNRITDALRREKVHEQALALARASTTHQDQLLDGWLEEARLPDSLLRMIFVCCHGALERKSQIALTLKTLCGFGVGEIARGLLLPPETVKKRLQRARQTLARLQVDLELPAGEDLDGRRAVVHDVLYLLFNEGYSASRGSQVVRDDICEEAVRLCHLLCESDTGSAVTCALLALLLFHSARLAARTDEAGATVLLEDQDRSLWDPTLIRMGQFWLAKSKGPNITTFHLEAGIAHLHCVARSVEATDWKMIVKLYDRLLVLRPSSIYQLNRAIALGQTGAVEEALAALSDLADNPELRDYLLLDCALARLHELNHNDDAAIDAYLRALHKPIAEHEKELVERKLRRLTAR